ncbi:hypothetical protein COCOBI_05-5020 [Coccomyxa sp. Obi]|nr:hypothetical protein COCOBI_05-5020 [Coccomyxa sp. Obi]
MALSVVSRGVKHPGSLDVEPAAKIPRLSESIRSVASLPLGGVGVVADAEGPSGLKQVISPERLQIHVLLAEKAEVVKALEKIFWQQFTVLRQNSDIENFFPYFLDVFNAALESLDPEHTALDSFDGCDYNLNRPWNYTFRHVAYACVTYYDQPHLLAESDSERKARLDMVMGLYGRVVVEGAFMLQEAFSAAEVALSQPVEDYLQSLSGGDEEVLLEFCRQWCVYIHTVRERNATGGHPFTIAKTLNTASDVLDHADLYEQAMACQPDLVQGIEKISGLSLAYTRATATSARKKQQEAVAAKKGKGYVPKLLPKVSPKQQQDSASSSAATSGDDSYVMFQG